MLRSVHEIVQTAERNYVYGVTNMGKYVQWQMHDTIEKIDAYLTSNHTSGDTDSLGREKPFFNIVTAAANIWYRATDLDRKDIKYYAESMKAMILASIANVLLRQWMDENRFGAFLNQWGRALARYGSAVVKFVKKDGTLHASVVPWNRLIVDPVDFYALPRIEKFYKTPAQLQQNQAYDQAAVDELLEVLQTRRTLDKQQQDTRNDFIELYEVHGELPDELLKDAPDDTVDPRDCRYVQQMHVIAMIKADKETHTFTLYKGKEARDPYMITHLIEEDGRTLAIGAVEYLFDAQWMANHTVKNMKDTLDLASKLIFQTSDTKFVGRNILSAIETGQVLITAQNQPITRLANDKPDISALQNFGTMWQSLGQELTSTPEALRGTTLPSGTPYSLGAYLGGQAGSLFEVMTENKGFYVEDMIREHITPFIKRKIRKMGKKELLVELDEAGIREIDAMYVPAEAVKRYNARSVDQLLNLPDGPLHPSVLPQPFNPQAEQQGIQQSLQTMGNKRSFLPDEFDKQTWDEVFSDFQWDNVTVNVTGETEDKKAVLQTLSTVFHDVVQFGPMIDQNPTAKYLLSEILNETGKLSPLQIPSGTASPPVTPTPVTSNATINAPTTTAGVTP